MAPGSTNTYRGCISVWWAKAFGYNEKQRYFQPYFIKSNLETTIKARMVLAS